MNPHGFEIKINGERLCRAGFDAGQYGLICLIDLKKNLGKPTNEMEITVAGAEGETIKQIHWVMQQALRRGDRITIEVVSGNFDPPLSYHDTHQKPPAIDFKNAPMKEILDLGRELFDN